MDLTITGLFSITSRVDTGQFFDLPRALGTACRATPSKLYGTSGQRGHCNTDCFGVLCCSLSYHHCCQSQTSRSGFFSLARLGRPGQNPFPCLESQLSIALVFLSFHENAIPQRSLSCDALARQRRREQKTAFSQLLGPALGHKTFWPVFGPPPCLPQILQQTPKSA